MPIDRNAKNRKQEPLRILVIAASARIGSWNAKLAQLTADEIKEKGVIADL